MQKQLIAPLPSIQISLNVRSEPILNGEFMTSIHMGEKYPYIKKEGEWIQIACQMVKKVGLPTIWSWLMKVKK